MGAIRDWGLGAHRARQTRGLRQWRARRVWRAAAGSACGSLGEPPSSFGARSASVPRGVDGGLGCEATGGRCSIAWTGTLELCKQEAASWHALVCAALACAARGAPSCLWCVRLFTPSAAVCSALHLAPLPQMSSTTFTVLVKQAGGANAFQPIEVPQDAFVASLRDLVQARFGDVPTAVVTTRLCIVPEMLMHPYFSHGVLDDAAVIACAPPLIDVLPLTIAGVRHGTCLLAFKDSSPPVNTTLAYVSTPPVVVPVPGSVAAPRPPLAPRAQLLLVPPTASPPPLVRAGPEVIAATAAPTPSPAWRTPSAAAVVRTPPSSPVTSAIYRPPIAPVQGAKKPLSTVLDGVVESWDRSRSLGRIRYTRDDGREGSMFVHFSDIEGDGFRFLCEGEGVSFSIASGINPGQVKAVNVKITSPSPSRRSSSPSSVGSFKICDALPNM